jgi:peptidoglycan/LPS O-acetylase OafA/YrhL
MSTGLDTRGERGAVHSTPTAPSAGTRPGFRPDIQGLRAIAVTLVILNHFFGWPQGGFIGVDVFFVISGYLISDLLLRELRLSGRISMREFYARRMRRIFPMAVVVLFATVTIAYALFTPQRADSTAIDALWAFLFVENWHLAIVGTDYFRMGDAVSPVQQYWSLSVEEQYYLVWPLLLIGIAAAARWLFGNRYRLPNAWRLKRVGSPETMRLGLVQAVLVLIVAASFAWAMYQTVTSPTVAYFSTLTRAWELGAGALLAVFAYTRPTRLGAAPRGIAVAAGLLLVLASALLIVEGVGFPAPWALVPVLGTLVVLRYGLNSSGVAPRLLATSGMQYLGEISYSLYLWHFPVMVFTFSIFAPSPLVATVGIAISVGLSAASFVLIEDPIRHSRWLTKKSERYPQQPLPTPNRTQRVDWRRIGRVAKNTSLTLAALALVGVAATGVYPRMVTTGTNFVAATLGPDPTVEVDAPSPPVEGAQLASEGIGFDHYAALKVAQQQALAATEFPNFVLEPGWNQLDASTTVPECVQGTERSAICEFTEEGATKTAMMLGDSQLQAWLPAIREALAGQGYNLKVFVLPGCTTTSVQTNYLFSGEVFEYCTTFREEALSQIEQAKPDLTLATSLVESYQVQTNDKGAAADQAWRTGVAATMSRLGAASQRAVLLDSPPLGAPVTECQTRFASPDDCETTITTLYQNVTGLNGAGASDASRQGYPIVHVPVSDWFCYEGVCPSFVGLNPTYSDRLHVSPSFGKFVAPLLRAPLIG